MAQFDFTKHRCPVCYQMHPPGVCPANIQEPGPSGVAFLPKKKEMVRIVVDTGHVYDLVKPDDFDMAVFMTHIKANGHILNHHMWQPIDHIVTIFIYSVDAPPKGQNNVVQFPGEGT